MKNFAEGMVLVVAAAALAISGCGSSSDGGPGGSGGTGGGGGTGGSAGSGGSGGTEPPVTGVYSGTGNGPDGPFDICFVVNEGGTALVLPPMSSPGSTCSTDPTYSFAVEFPDCEGALLEAGEIPLTNGMFELVREEGGAAGYWIIRGTIDGSSASGEATVGNGSGGTCTGTWTAMLSP